MKRILRLMTIFVAVGAASFAQTAIDTTLAQIMKQLADLTAQVQALQSSTTKTQQIVATSQANGVQPGMGGIPMTGLIPTNSSLIRGLGSLSGPPIDTSPTTGCDADLFRQYRTEVRQSDDMPKEWSCAHINITAVVQAGYKSKTNGNCYWSDWTGTYKFPRCYVGLPEWPTNADGTLVTKLQWDDPSINWQAAGGRCVYTLGDTASGYYGQTANRECGFGSRGAPPLPSEYCGKYPNDSTCNMNPTAAATGTATSATSGPTMCRLSSECGGKACLMVTSTSPGTCSTQ